MTVFIREAPIEENIASAWIRTVATTYDCKILHPYKYGANEYGYEAKVLRMIPQEYQLMQHKRQLIIGLRSSA